MTSRYSLCNIFFSPSRAPYFQTLVIYVLAAEYDATCRLALQAVKAVVEPLFVKQQVATDGLQERAPRCS
jgi:hypothetical protein